MTVSSAPAPSLSVPYPASESRFRVMGSDAHVLVTGVGSADRGVLLAQAEQRLRELEGLWSRFIDDSEISNLNRTDGPLAVSPETFQLIELAIIGWERTAGRFDPTVHDAVLGSGYGGQPAAISSNASPGCAFICLDRANNTVELPPNVRIDPGGIGKGLAADLVSQELLDDGADGALVSLGGDLRVRGVSPDPAGWLIEIGEPSIAPGSITRLVLVDGAVATSTTEKRRWVTDGEVRHHLIDPSTGHSHDRTTRLATVVSRDAWWAEVCTKQLFGVEPVEMSNVIVDAEAMILTDSGELHRSSNFERYES